MSFLFNVEENEIIKEYEKFLVNTVYSSSVNFDLTHLNSRSRVIKITALKLLALVFSLRCIVNILWPTDYMRDLTCNGYHYLGDSVLANMGFLGGSLPGSLMLAATQQYFIFSGQSYQFEYMNKIKYRRLDYRLNNRFNNKFFRIFKWISFGVNTQFIPSFLFVSVLYCSPTVIGYFDPDIKFNLYGMLLYFFHCQDGN